MKRPILCSICLALALVMAGTAGARAPAPGKPEANAPAAAKRTANYRGQAKNGQPISFRVVTKGGKSRIKGLAVDVVTECWADLNDDGIEDKIVAHITKLHGKVSRSGEVDVYYAPDDDTEYIVEGTLINNKAKLNVIVGGRFSPDGIPNAGDLDCDNWGTRYKAKPAR
jgi:hypothetical protein